MSHQNKTTIYRLADLPGYGRLRVPAHLDDSSVLQALSNTAPDPRQDVQSPASEASTETE